MNKEIETKFIEGNLRYKWKNMQDLESIEIEKKIPKYPVLFLTCMDPRIDIHRIFQLDQGDVFILRNAGNQYTQDMFRSILLMIVNYNIKYIIILGHLDCEMTKISLTELRRTLPSEFLSSLSRNYSELYSKLNAYLKPFRNEIENILIQVKNLDKIKHFYPEIEITGMLYDPKTGLVFEYDKFKHYRVNENFEENYKKILVEKKYQFTEFLEKYDKKKVTFEDSKDLAPIGEINEPETSIVSNEDKELKNISIIEPDEFNMHYDNKVQTILPKIRTPKIQFHGVKIYIPKIIREKRKISENN